MVSLANKTSRPPGTLAEMIVGSLQLAAKDIKPPSFPRASGGNPLFFLLKH
jgi:hypothetical protein